MTNRERAWYIVGIASDLLGDKAREMADEIERALDAAVRDAVADVQAQLDAERKAHAETRAALEKFQSATIGRGHSSESIRIANEMARAALAASTRAKGDDRG